MAIAKAAKASGMFLNVLSSVDSGKKSVSALASAAASAAVAAAAKAAAAVDGSRPLTNVGPSQHAVASSSAVSAAAAAASAHNIQKSIANLTQGGSLNLTNLASRLSQSSVQALVAAAAVKAARAHAEEHTNPNRAATTNASLLAGARLGAHQPGKEGPGGANVTAAAAAVAAAAAAAAASSQINNPNQQVLQGRNANGVPVLSAPGNVSLQTLMANASQMTKFGNNVPRNSFPASFFGNNPALSSLSSQQLSTLSNLSGNYILLPPPPRDFRVHKVRRETTHSYPIPLPTLQMGESPVYVNQKQCVVASFFTFFPFFLLFVWLPVTHSHVSLSCKLSGITEL